MCRTCISLASQNWVTVKKEQYQATSSKKRQSIAGWAKNKLTSMFRPVHQVAAPGSASTVSDCILLLEWDGMAIGIKTLHAVGQIVSSKYMFVNNYLASASSSPIVTKFGQSYPWPQGIRWLNFGRSRSRSKVKVGGEVCALLSPSSFRLWLSHLALSTLPISD